MQPDGSEVTASLIRQLRLYRGCGICIGGTSDGIDITTSIDSDCFRRGSKYLYLMPEIKTMKPYKNVQTTLEAWRQYCLLQRRMNWLELSIFRQYRLCPVCCMN